MHRQPLPCFNSTETIMVVLGAADSAAGLMHQVVLDPLDPAAQLSGKPNHDLTKTNHLFRVTQEDI